MGRAVLQYNHCTCDTVQVLGPGQTGRAGGRWAGAGCSAGRAERARGVQARHWACAGGQALGRAGRHEGGRARARGAQTAGSRRGRHERTGAGRAWTRGAGGRRTAGAAGGRQRRGRRAGPGRTGRAGWPWAVHSVHSVYFQSIFRLGIFPESLNEHCSL